MPSRCPNSRLIVANIVSRSVRLLTSARTARPPAPSVSLAAFSVFSFKPQMATRAPSLSNSCAAASPIPLLPPVIRIFLFASLPMVVTPLGGIEERLESFQPRPLFHSVMVEEVAASWRVLGGCDHNGPPESRQSSPHVQGGS